MDKVFDIQLYCNALVGALRANFGNNLRYVGLQGSYLRNEATEQSDIDVMVVFETLTKQDMQLYKQTLKSVGEYERACGFVCSVEELRNWNALEICQLGYTTKDLYGKLADFLPRWTVENEIEYVKTSLNNLYHALCHSYIHSTQERLLSHLTFYYKSAYFILQNTYFLQTLKQDGKGQFVLPKAQLLQKLQGQDKAVLQTLLQLQNGKQLDFDTLFDLIFDWCKQKMAEVK